MRRRDSDGETEAAVREELDELGGGLARSGLAAAALTLARDLDNPRNSATSHAMCAKALLDVMNRLRERAPVKATDDPIDRIAARHDRRRKRLSAV